MCDTGLWPLESRSEKRKKEKNSGGGLGGWRLPSEGEEQKLSFSRFFFFVFCVPSL